MRRSRFVLRLKRVVAGLLIVLFTFSLAGCASGNPDTARWEDYVATDFMSLLKTGLGKYYLDYFNEDIDIKVYNEDGWEKSEELDEDDIKFGNKAITYIVDIETETNEKVVYHFFMELKQNKLYAKGYFLRNEYGKKEYDDYDTEKMLNSVVKWVESASAL